MTAMTSLCRSVPSTLRMVSTGSGESDGLTFEGYGAVFNAPTRINSWEGLFDEQIARGAFVTSLREQTPKFQFDHGHHPMIGSLPVGSVTDIYEDEHGLFVRARMAASPFWEPLREALTPVDQGGTGAVDGMSFRFSVVRESWVDKNGAPVRPDEVERILWDPRNSRGPLMRTLTEVKIQEVGPVVWPAYPQTSAGLRSTAQTLPLSVAQRRLKLLDL